MTGYKYDGFTFTCRSDPGNVCKNTKTGDAGKTSYYFKDKVCEMCMEDVNCM